jgi:uncharacterized membrane protein
MTLLVVELAVPALTSNNPEQLTQALQALGPKYLSFSVSFLVIASYWTSHQRIFSYIVHADSRLVWLNLFLLLCIAFQPFPTSVLGTYGNTPAVTFYAGTLCVTGLLVLALWVYATWHRRLVTPQISAKLIQHHTVRAASVPLLFFVSMFIAQVNAEAAKYSWLGIAVIIGALRLVYRDARE